MRKSRVFLPLLEGIYYPLAQIILFYKEYGFVPLNILISYYYCAKIDLDKIFGEIVDKYGKFIRLSVFADSGAFSAMTLGAEIKLDEYASWLKTWKHWFCSYVNLDVIGNAEETLHNQIELEDRHGIRAIPVFHIREDFKYLDKYCEDYDYIGLGVAKTGWDIHARWLAHCYQIINHRSAVHGFGLTHSRCLNSFAWYSVDSTSWRTQVIFGKFFVLGDGRSITGLQRKGLIDPKNKVYIMHALKLFNDLGIKSEDHIFKVDYTKMRFKCNRDIMNIFGMINFIGSGISLRRKTREYCRTPSIHNNYEIGSTIYVGIDDDEFGLLYRIADLLVGAIERLT